MTRHSVNPDDRLTINAVLVSARQAIDIICDRWTLTLLLALFQGEQRFGGLHAQTGMATRLLTGRLQMLAESGILLRVPYSLRPERFDYRLTNMGTDLGNVLLHMARWEAVWSDQSRSPQRFSHDGCGAVLSAIVGCRACGEPVDARQIETRASRAQLAKTPAKQSRHRRSTLQSAVALPQALGPTLDLFGDKWSIEVLICAFFRVHRFGDFRDSIGIAANILSDRLARLVAVGLLSQEKAGASATGYWLTPKGIDVYPIMVAVHEWADAWVRARYKSPVRLIHRGCGKPFLPMLACTTCAKPMMAGNIRLAVR